MTSERDVGHEILNGIREIKAFKRDEGEELRAWCLEEPSSASEVRERLGLSREEFEAPHR